MGNTVVTTFDARLQKIAYNALGTYEGTKFAPVKFESYICKG